MNTTQKELDSQNTKPNLQISGAYCQLSVDGTNAGFFHEFQNIGKQLDISEYKIIGEGGQEIVEKKPGRLRNKRVTLKREMTSNLDMWEWRRMVEVGDISSERKDCVVTAYDAGSTEIASWVLENAWPLGVVSERDSSGTNFEVITLATDKLYRLS